MCGRLLRICGTLRSPSTTRADMNIFSIWGATHASLTQVQAILKEEQQKNWTKFGTSSEFSFCTIFSIQPNRHLTRSSVRRIRFVDVKMKPLKSAHFDLHGHSHPHPRTLTIWPTFVHVCLLLVHVAPPHGVAHTPRVQHLNFASLSCTWISSFRRSHYRHNRKGTIDLNFMDFARTVLCWRV